MSTFTLTASFGEALLLRAAALLCCFWLAHACFRAHPRARIMLCRIVAAGLMMLPFFGFLPSLGVVHIPLNSESVAWLGFAGPSRSDNGGVWILSQTPLQAPDAGITGAERDHLPGFFAQKQQERASLQFPTDKSFEGGDTDLSTANAHTDSDRLTPPPASHSWSMGEALASLWITGSLLLLLRWAMALVLVQYWTSGAQNPPAWVYALSRRICRQLGKRGAVRLGVLRRSCSPMLLGFRSYVVLPAHLIREEKPEDLTCALAHELVHAVRRDWHWSQCLAVLTAIYWPVPLIWFLRRSHDATSELVCDHIAASIVGEKKAYAESLARQSLRALELMEAPLPGLATVPMLRKSGIRYRVDLLLSGYVPPQLSGRVVAGTLIGGLLIGLVLSGAILVQAQKSEPILENPKPSSVESEREQEKPVSEAAAPVIAMPLVPLAGNSIANPFSSAAAVNAPELSVNTTFTFLARDPAGAPVSGAEVYLLQYIDAPKFFFADYPKTKAYGPVLTGTDGRATFSDVVPFGEGPAQYIADETTAKWSYGCDVYARVPGKLAGVRSLIYVSPQERKDGIIIPLARTKSLKGKIDVKEVVAMDKVRVKVLSWWLNIHEGRFFGARRNKDDREPWPQLVEFSPDAQGEVTIPDVPVGTFINIAARCPGIPDVELSQFLVKQRDEKFSLALHPQDTTRRYGTLKGTVRNKEGKGVGGVDIGCVGRTQEPDPSSQVYYGKADSDGHYQIPDVLAGTYEVQLYPPGGTVYLPVQGVKVVPGGISKADLLIEPGTELTGQILDKKTGKGVSRACLAFYADSDPKGAQPYTALPYATARVDENGAFKIKLPGGKSKFYLIESPFYKNQYQSTSIEVVNGKALKPLICELEPETPGSGFFSIQGQPATIKGRVLDPAGNPLPDIEVYEGIVSSREIERLRLGVGRVITAADGTYTLKTYWKGECCVTVRDATTSQTQSKVFTVAEGGEYQVEDLTVRMATASISGKVVDTAGKPVANSEVRAFSESKGFESFVVQTDKDGVFRLSPVVDDEQFKLQIYAPGPRFAEGKIKPDLKNAVFVVRKAVRK